MECFKVVMEVLDESYHSIPGDSTAKDAAIKGELERLSRHYLNLTRSGAVDYSNSVTRFAYIYKYVTSHANMVYDAIRDYKELAEIFERDIVRVACIGGGPGSDFLGVLKYLIRTSQTPYLRCATLDRDRTWGESWRDVDEKVDANFRLSTSFDQLDITDASTWKPQVKYLQSDLFSMIYFMSEVYKEKDETNEYFKHLFGGAKSGSFFLFIDNNSPEFYNWFDELAGSNSVDVIHREQGRTRLYDGLEQKADLGVYYEKFGSLNHCRPKLEAQIALRIGRKA